jgi:hypothetical protein
LKALIYYVSAATVAMAAPALFAFETEGVVEIDVEVTLLAGSEIDLVIPIFTKTDSSKFNHNGNC